MTEIIGDYVEPSELRVPEETSAAAPTYAGALYLSGTDLIIVTAANTPEVITSTA